MGVLSHSGRRVISFFFPVGPTRAVRSSRASEVGSWAEGFEMKEEREGPLLRRSWKVVLGWGGLRSDAEGSVAAVAKARQEGR